MRIISGRLRGRRLTPPAKLSVRPTTEVAREALFNILWSRYDLEDIDVIDLFSGTGFISYEFYSRGAKSVTAVEKNPGCIAFISDCIEKLEMNNISLIKSDAFKFIDKYKKDADIVFADPPFDLPSFNELPDLILNSGIIKDGGILILEHGKAHNFQSHPNFIMLKRYGHVYFSFFNKNKKLS